MTAARTILGLALLAACAAPSQPARATAFCWVLKSPDGFVALREQPNAKARVIVRMREGDDVLALDGHQGRWQQVRHWRSGDRSKDVTRTDTHIGWVHSRYISECG